MRISRYTFVTLAAVLMLAASAQAAQPQRSRIRVPLPPAVHVAWGYSDDIADVCGGYTACTDPDAHVVYAPIGLDWFALEHEKGHVFDAEVLDDNERAALMQRMGLRPGRWTTSKTITDPTTGLSVLEERGGYECTPQKCPNELFADAYATCRLRLIPGVSAWPLAYGWNPRMPRAQRRVCRFIAVAARTPGTPALPDGGG